MTKIDPFHPQVVAMQKAIRPFVRDDLTALAAALEAFSTTLPSEDEDHPDEPEEAAVSEYDTLDSRGVQLRPSVNEAGEPWWM
jgi:hypothetical protein